MRVIYKYLLKDVDKQEVEMPTESKILSVGVQSKDISLINEPVIIEDIALWAMVEIDRPNTTIRTIHIIGTGKPVPEVQLKFIGTFQLRNGSIGHVFEE